MPGLPGRDVPLLLSSRRAFLLAAASLALPARADLSALVTASRPSVLPVGTFDPLASPRFGFRGSGFVVGDGNLVVTNAHVLPDMKTTPPPQLAVLVAATGEMAQGRRAALVHVDDAHDLALLRVDGPPLPALTLAAADSVREGLDVALMGYPIGGLLGFSTVTHRGIIASITKIALPSLAARNLDAKAISRLRDGPFEVYQLDATAYPGNSGGPLLNAATGEVVGVINMVLVRGTRESALANPTGITYAIPVRFVRELLQRPR